MGGNSFPTPVPPSKPPSSCSPTRSTATGPNDQGIGWNILFSLQRVAMGFGLAALVGIPLGFMIGRFATLNRMCRR
jgi:nitrate/nitrite transport system permease protein